MSSCERKSDAGSRPPPQRHERGFSQLNHFHDLVQTISNQDAQSRYRQEAADNQIEDDDIIENSESEIDSNSSTSDSNPGSNPPVRPPTEEKKVISWKINDPENPHNFTTRKKMQVLLTTVILILNSTMGSSLPSMAVPAMTKEWGVTAENQFVLPMSCFLIGYVLGPIFWGPLSEHVGRRKPTIGTFLMFMVWTLACAVSPNWAAFLVFRFFTGAFASAPNALVAGILSDIYGDPKARGRAMAWFMATTVWGPLFAPIISGYCSTTIGWRWTFWIGLIYAGMTSIPVLLLPETYAPVLLARRAAKMRKADPTANVYAAMELEPHDFKQLAGVVLTRPLRMVLTELIVAATCLYLALIYAIFYMSFQAFPIIFQEVYGLSPGVTGLCFLPVGLGALCAVPVFFAYDGYLARAKLRGASWTQREEARRVPLAFLAGPVFVISLFWLGWSASPNVSFAAPMLAGIPFGFGFQMIFIALLNYLTDAYEIFAASANAAASSCRSVFAVVLPLATTPMFRRLGISGACSLLGGLSALMCIIPFIFFMKGERLRAGSKFCMALKERKLEMERNAEEDRLRRELSRTYSAAAAPPRKKEEV